MSKTNEDINKLTMKEILKNMEDDLNDLTFNQISIYKRLIERRARIGKTKDLIVEKE